MTRVKPVLLCILDGWGLRKEREANAIALADTPVTSRWTEHGPNHRLFTSGLHVGLPDGQMGNSEVGHTNLGAGRIVYQDLVRIDRAVEDGSLAKNPVIAEALRKGKEGGGLHLLGLVSDGGVHSQLTHLLALLRAASAAGVAQTWVHAFLDGRDTPPRSAEAYLAKVEETIAQEQLPAAIATVSGRFYAMDRDQRWERVLQAYRALVQGEGFTAKSAQEALQEAYARGENDEFVQPTIVRPEGLLRDGNSALFFNFRSDRAREITQLLAFEQPPAGVDRPARPQLGFYGCMTEYKADFGLPVAYPPDQPTRILPEIVAERGLGQFRCAETEKYAHVTFFFNGGRELVFPGEQRQLVQSPRDVKTYDLKPEMSANEVADALVRAIDGKQFQLIICNFANADMVGHTGDLAATIRAISTVDACLGRLEKACEKAGMAMIVTADHGNAEQMVDPVTGEPHTAHTTLPVPIWLVDPALKGAKLREGILADVAPTVLQLMGLPAPKEMGGTPLVVR